MTLALTELAQAIEAEMLDLAKGGAKIDTLVGFHYGYRSALRARNAIGDLEDEALSRHFEGWQLPEGFVVDPD